MAKILVFIPSFRGQISATTFETSHALMSTLAAKGITASIATYSWYDIAELRNMVLSVWYDTMKESTHLLFVDDDMGFPPQMVLDMLTLDEPVVGAIYPKRGSPLDFVGSGIEAAEYRAGFIEVEGVGGGCLLIRRDAVEAMLAYFGNEMIGDYMVVGDLKAAGGCRTLRFFDQFHTAEGKMSEDIAFCKRWRLTGGKVWASVAHNIQHVGPWIFSGCFAKERDEERRDAEAAE